MLTLAHSGLDAIVASVAAMLWQTLPRGTLSFLQHIKGEAGLTRDGKQGNSNARAG